MGDAKTIGVLIFWADDNSGSSKESGTMEGMEEGEEWSAQSKFSSKS